MQQQVMESELRSIKNRLDSLTTLYKNLLDVPVKTGKASPDERKATASKEKLMSEKDLYNAMKT